MGLGGAANVGGGSGDHVRRERGPVDALRRLGERGVVRVRGHGHPHLHVPPHGHLREVPQKPNNFLVAAAAANNPVGFFSWSEYDPFGRGVSNGVAAEASSSLFSQNERVCKWSIGVDARRANTHLPRPSRSSSNFAAATSAAALSSRARFSASPSTAQPLLAPPLSFSIHWELAMEPVDQKLVCQVDRPQNQHSDPPTRARRADALEAKNCRNIMCHPDVQCSRGTAGLFHSPCFFPVELLLL